MLTRSDVLAGGVDVSTAGGGHTFLAGNGSAVTLPVTDAQDPGGGYTAAPFSLFKIETTTVLGAQASLPRREAVLRLLRDRYSLKQ